MRASLVVCSCTCLLRIILPHKKIIFWNFSPFSCSRSVIQLSDNRPTVRRTGLMLMSEHCLFFVESNIIVLLCSCKGSQVRANKSKIPYFPRPAIQRLVFYFIFSDQRVINCIIQQLFGYFYWTGDAVKVIKQQVVKLLDEEEQTQQSAGSASAASGQE